MAELSADDKNLDDNEKFERCVGWAEDVLTRAGFELWSESKTYGDSRYYLVVDADGPDVFVRVSDHHAESPRVFNGDVVYHFEVLIDVDASFHAIEARTREAIQKRAEFMLSPEFLDICEEWRKSQGF